MLGGGGDLSSYSGPISCPRLNLVAREEEKKGRKEKEGQLTRKNLEHEQD